VFDSSAKFPVGLLAGNQYQMGHYDECVEILVDTGERFGGQLKGQYCLAEIWFESSFSPRTDPYTLNYDPQASAWEKIKVRNEKEFMTANNMSTDFFVRRNHADLHALIKCTFYNINKLRGNAN
jgi:hypothetical protein